MDETKEVQEVLKEVVDVLVEISKVDDATEKDRENLLISGVVGMLKKYPEKEGIKKALKIAVVFGGPVIKGAMLFLANKITPTEKPEPLSEESPGEHG
jgi:hypothetical protein